MARTRWWWSAIHRKFKMSMTKGSFTGVGVAEAAWIVAPASRTKRQHRRPTERNREVAILGASLQRCAIADSNEESTETKRSSSSQAPVWMTNLVSQPPPEDAKVRPQQQHILLLVGVPGSGKSTLSETLCRVLPWRYQQVNQDALGHRKACLRLTQSILDAGYCPIIDRCNVSREQRQYFTNFCITGSGTVIPVDCMVLRTVPIGTCVRRCKKRGPNHPTLQPKDVDRVMRLLQREWEPPSLDREQKLRSVTTVTSEEMLQSVVLKLIADAVGEPTATKEPKESLEEDNDPKQNVE
jgi:energy-coupling factor transporter ATP-binding protein EcfA2